MAVHFHKLTVREVKNETPECVSIAFTVPGDLQAEFLFEHGQNITIKKEIDGEEIRRSYSICSAPFENELRVAVKKVAGGKFSTYANSLLKAGDTLDVLPPTGKFNTKLNTQNSKQYVAFAAGSGITPVISIIKTTLQTEPASRFTLVFGNRGRHAIIFFEELEALKNKYLNRFNFINILSREKTDAPISFGRIDINKLTELNKLIDYKSADDFFICGPEEMIFCVKDFLEQMNIDHKKIHFELFTTPGQKKAGGGSREAGVENKGPKSKITVKLDGRSFDFDLGFNSENILDAALKQGADLPFACKGGVCCTCKARLVEGEVQMDVNWGLEQEEVEQGYILTCQSHPTTEKVVVDFDIK
ncbi:MAG: phenylacetate-CoA oxygenase/reductase subunit PaaK [Chitinophagaceae bacterium]|nr:phenylacetate-CoA oxygenase/reductase subunit PaaK [Chitinophagaceae bacterium]